MRRLFIPCLLLLLFLLQEKAVLAADELGAEISYSCTDADSSHFLIQVTRYYACSSSPGIQAPVIDISGSCGSPVAPGNWQTSGLVEVTPICPGIATICNGQASPILDGVSALVYSRKYDFSGLGCDDFMISYYSCCRPATLQNGAAGEGLFVQAGPLDPFLCNHAPEFLYPPVILLDTATEAFVALGANDPDGDSLAYQLVSCMDTFGTANSYLTRFSATQPLDTNWTVRLDNRTGNIHFLPKPGAPPVKGTLCVEMREYRAGQLISKYVRDIMVEAVSVMPEQPSPSLPTLLPPDADSVWGGTWLGPNIVRASIGEPVIFELDVNDAENDSTTQISWTRNIPELEFYEDGVDATQRKDIFYGKNPTIEVKYIPTSKGRKFFGVRLNDTAWCGLANIRDFTFGIDIRDTSFLAAFDSDTLFICMGDTLNLSPNIYGIPSAGPLDYQWTSGPRNAVYQVFTPGTYEVLVRDTFGLNESFERQSKASVVVAYAPYCVWPGDADNDGVANNFDVLAIGLGYGQTGPSRSDQGIDWSGKQATPWGDTTALGGLEVVYANTNGDGIINADDTLAISQNYGLSHLKGGSNHGIPLFLYTPQTFTHVGASVSVFVVLGLDTLLADSVYGLAFSVAYDNSLVDSASAHFMVDSTWLGDPASDLFSMQKDLFLDGQIDIGISRNNHQTRTGYGQIARLDIVMVDDIFDKRKLVDTLILRIENVRMINARGQEIPVEVEGEVQIAVDDVNSILPPLPPGSLRLFPNPTKNHLNIEVNTTEEVDIYVYSLEGREMLSLKHVRGKKQIDLSHLNAGMYLLRASNSQGQIHKKIILSE